MVSRPPQRSLARTSGRPRSDRRGTAAVEFAVCLPLIVTLVFASIEAANSVYLKQTLTTAAYEGAREASRTGGLHNDAVAAAQAVLDAKGVSGYTISITPTVSLATASGTQVTVTVTAPASANAIGPQFFYQSATLDAVVDMVRQ